MNPDSLLAASSMILNAGLILAALSATVAMVLLYITFFAIPAE